MKAFEASNLLAWDFPTHTQRDQSKLIPERGENKCGPLWQQHNGESLPSFHSHYRGTLLRKFLFKYSATFICRKESEWERRSHMWTIIAFSLLISSRIQQQLLEGLQLKPLLWGLFKFVSGCYSINIFFFSWKVSPKKSLTFNFFVRSIFINFWCGLMTNQFSHPEQSEHGMAIVESKSSR